MYLDQATISTDKSIKDVLYGYGEFEHLRQFLNDYLGDNYKVVIFCDETESVVKHIVTGKYIHRHHSFSNCVEWVFNNCELDKGL